MTKENRFEGLMGVVGKNKNAQTSKHSDVQKSRRKKKSDSKSDVETSKSLNISTFDNSDIQTPKVQADNSNSNVSTSKHTDAQTSRVAKSANPDYTRTTVYLPKKMHKKLKAIAIDEEKEMSSIVEELIETWLNSRS
ncbi:MAG: ribbon-helix-helix domain-containing protein [Pleurocapsa sp. MO_192.B19]|nr:ribbon-helix-helix domain-containing protein [Pleurocapsa sp. MO_192.B19]